MKLTEFVFNKGLKMSGNFMLDQELEIGRQ